MKIRTSIRLALGLGLLAARGALATDYPLVCRGGGNMRFGFLGDRHEVQVVFAHGTGPASDGIPPGTCTWIDRGVNPDEPYRTCDSVGDVYIGWTASGKVNGMGTVRAPYLFTLRSPNRTFIFQVHNEHENNCFRVTRLGP